MLKLPMFPTMDDADQKRREEMIEAELDMEADGVKPIPRQPEDGIAAMENRIQYLESMPSTPSTARDLLEARARLAEYKRLHEGRN